MLHHPIAKLRMDLYMLNLQKRESGCAAIRSNHSKYMEDMGSI